VSRAGCAAASFTAASFAAVSFAGRTEKSENRNSAVPVSLARKSPPDVRS
jgi:hypothetical protein